MGYSLGIDVGTTYSAAAVCRDGGTVEVCTLGTTSQAIPSIVVLREDGEILTGEAAERRAPSEPARTAREFKRRLGDPVPIIIGTTPYGAEALMAFMVGDIVAQVTAREGSAPDVVVLTHPANYSDYKRDLLGQAARLAGLDLASVQFASEPQAAAAAYASQRRVDAGEVVAVYDFGGGTFDAAVVRKDSGEGFTLLGNPEGMERLGGIDIDQAVLSHVDQSVGGLVSAAGSDPSARPALVRLREEARRAKEALSADTDATIAVSLPGLQTEVRITREELESMVRPRLTETVDALRRAVTSSGATMEQVSRVLLVGGSSRIPLVGLLVRELTGRPVAVDAHPKLAIATGAALIGAATLGQAAVVPVADAPASPASPAAMTAPTPPPGSDAKRLAATAAAGFAGTGAAALSGLGGSAAAAASGAAATGAAGPAGIALTSGPAGASLAAGPAGSSLTAGPSGIPLQTVRAVAKARHLSKPMMLAGSVGVAAAAGVIAVVGPGGDKVKPPPASVSSPAPSRAGARGVTGLTTLTAGKALDNSGKGVPGPATAVSLGAPGAVIVGPDGSAYVLDSATRRVVRISKGQATVAYASTAGIGGLAVSPTGSVVLLTIEGLVNIGSNGQATTIATLAQLGEGVSAGQQSPLAFDGAGNLYLGNSNRFQVLRRSTTGAMSLVAGTGESAAAPGVGDGSAATAAPLRAMTALVVDAGGNLLIGEATGAIRKVSGDGTISTIAGAGATKLADSAGRFAADGIKAVDLLLGQVSALALDPSNRLHVGDSASSAIVRINSDGTATFIAGDQSGSAEPTTAGLPANQTRIANADGLAFDRSGGLFVADRGLLLHIEAVAAA